MACWLCHLADTQWWAVQSVPDAFVELAWTCWIISHRYKNPTKRLWTRGFWAGQPDACKALAVINVNVTGCNASFCCLHVITCVNILLNLWWLLCRRAEERGWSCCGSSSISYISAAAATATSAQVAAAAMAAAKLQQQPWQPDPCQKCLHAPHGCHMSTHGLSVANCIDWTLLKEYLCWVPYSGRNLHTNQA